MTTVGWDRHEASKRLSAFNDIKNIVTDNVSQVRPELSDAYFAAILYPVMATDAMNRKILGDSIDSHQAYEEIQALTARYGELKDGKWRHLMNASPRNLPVYQDVHATLSPDKPQPLFVKDASSFNQASQGAHSIQMLGHSMNAVSLPKGDMLTYSFHVDTTGTYTLQTRMIPTHAVDAGDIRYSVSIDGGKPTIYTLKEPFRSEQWKQNVLRCQAIRNLETLLSAGHHTLTIQALDEHILIDQWALYLNR
ncbi:MAG: hypothetical protein II812_03335 [Prevotella sp.]|nr:hypothetical protein [Prevotella sp.]